MTIKVVKTQKWVCSDGSEWFTWAEANARETRNVLHKRIEELLATYSKPSAMFLAKNLLDTEGLYISTTPIARSKV